MNPRRDNQNNVRLDFSTDTVVEVCAAYTNFTEGIAKICALPEYFPGEVKAEYNGEAFFVEIARDGSDIEVTPYYHYSTAEDGRTNLVLTVTNAYTEGDAISLQIGATNLQVYNGASLIVDAPHTVTNVTAIFGNGIFPHYEFQNTEYTTTATVQMSDLKCRSREGFGAGE